MTLAVAMRRALFLPPHRLGGDQPLQGFEQSTFPRLEDQVTAQVGGLAAEQGQQHDAPSHDGVDGDGAGQLGGALMLMGFDATTAFQNATLFLDPPTPRVPTQAAQRLFARLDGHGGQQDPTQRLGPFGRVDFREQQRPQFHRQHVPRLGCLRCADPHPVPAQLDLGLTIHGVNDLTIHGVNP